VTLSSSTSGATIRYTLDGSAPSETAGTVYTAPFTVSGTTTVKAMAYASGLTDSSVATAIYTIPAAAPIISSFSPTSGPATTAVTIAGSNFGSIQGSSTVTFSGTSAGTAASWSAGSITINVPSGATTGNVAVTVGGAASNGVSFTVISGPSITSLTPASRAVGTPVTITGSNFGSPQGSSTVTFNGVSAGTAGSWSATSIMVNVPGAATSGPVVVTVGGVASNGMTFTVTPVPLIASASPTSGGAAGQFTISGSGFGAVQGPGTVWLGSTYATATSWSDTQIIAKVASNSTSGTAQVQQGGAWSNSVPFTVNTATISTVTPDIGLPGTPVTITGSGFGGNPGQVWLGTAAGVVQSWSDSQIQATVGTGSTSGNAQVLPLQSGVMSNAVPFTVNLPQIESISPTSGTSGTLVTFTGSGFGSSPGTVWLGSTAGQYQ
jgi:hypothetical protein